MSSHRAMEDSEKVQALKTLAAAVKHRDNAARLRPLASVRVSPGSYLGVASIMTFASVLLLRAENDTGALIALVIAWLVIPALALSDRIVFDGRSLTRRGLIPFLFRLITGRFQELSLGDVERVETNAVRTLRRGGSVRYRYRTQVAGKGLSLVFASGGKSYRRMVRSLFPLIPEAKVDSRTRELRDYLCEPNSFARDIETLGLASPAVLDNAMADVKNRLANRLPPHEQSAHDLERARHLRQLANQLRVWGRLSEARESFRRALIFLPHDGWLIYEFGRLLRSQASALSDARLLSRARAALRLSFLRAGEDANLIALIGESQIECGDVERAERTLRRALSIDSENFRARIDLADIALRNGKLAHVIHQYRDAAYVAPDKALTLYARREGDYYARLIDDEDYLSAELRRIDWLQNSVRVRRVAARVTNASILIALVGPYVHSTVSGLGWSFASCSLFAWLGAYSLGKVLADRRKPRPAD
jgi:tetratricopeptide (TPR) repeat protein